METLADKLKKTAETPYEMLAREFETTVRYVGQIARGERKANRGKGLKIKEKIKEITEAK